MLNHIMRGCERELKNSSVERKLRAGLKDPTERLCDQDPMAWGMIFPRSRSQDRGGFS